ncbi:MAG TPA: hypothetical protein VF843_08500 [Streptosporangiaceae bacterium]
MREHARQGRAGRRLGTWLGWWIVLMAIWVILDDSVAVDELIAGALAAAVSAALTEVASHQAGVGYRIRLRWLTAAARLPAQVGRETAMVFAALGRRIATGQEPAGGFVAESVRPGPGAELGRTRRALLVGAQSLSPNKFVLGIDPERGELLAHKLVLGPGDAAR